MIIYDCEIVKAIPNKNEPPIPGIAYCKGWRDYAGMGISVIGVCDYETDQYQLFCKDNFPEFQALVDKTDVVVGFNNIAFDDQLCRANGISIPANKSYDLLQEIRVGARHMKASKNLKHGSLSLDACCQANFDYGKSGNGAEAPIWWQRGEIGKVIDYCLRDVWLTAMLLERVITSGAIAHPSHPGEDIPVAAPVIISFGSEADARPSPIARDGELFYTGRAQSSALPPDVEVHGCAIEQKHPHTTKPTVTVTPAPGYVVVCDNCLRASCVQGVNLCRNYIDASTVLKSIPELRMLGLEHDKYWEEAWT